MKHIRQIGFFGECMIELQGRPLQPQQQAFSGDTCNTAIYFNRLKHDAAITTAYITAIGVDPFSDAMLEGWQEEGIACDFVQRLPNRTPGIYHILVDEAGERSFSYWRGESAARYYFATPQTGELMARMADLDAFYLSGISLAILSGRDRDILLNFLSEYRARGGRIIFDNNYRPRLWPDTETARHHYNRILPLCDLALLTLDDEAALFGTVTAKQVLQRINPFAIPEVVIKQGPGDCVGQSREGGYFSEPACRVDRVVDTTAAGDSFSAAYIAARIAGKTPPQSAAAGHRLACQVIQHRGAIIPRETMNTIE